MGQEIKPDIKKLLKERARERGIVSMSIADDYKNKLKELAEKHGLTFSAMVEICIEVALADPHINPGITKEN